MQRTSLFTEPTSTATSPSRWAALLLCCLFACDKTDDLKGFFKAQPVDEHTSLTIETTPPLGASLVGNVDLDGQRIANKTPHTQKLLTPGKHMVRIEAAGYVSMELEALVEDGKENKVQATLSPRLTASEKPTPKTAKTALKGKKKGAKEPKEPKEEDAAPQEAPDTEANVHSTKTMIVTASPGQPAYLDGSPIGTASGLRVEVSKTAGEIKVGDDDGLTFTYANKGGHVRLKPKDLGQRSIVVDGHTPKMPWIDIDTRARRIEMTDVDGKKQTYLMKVLE